jgi:hypothetical protein
MPKKTSVCVPFIAFQARLTIYGGIEHCQYCNVRLAIATGAKARQPQQM